MPFHDYTLVLLFCDVLAQVSETLSRRVKYNPDSHSVLELSETSHKPPEATPSLQFGLDGYVLLNRVWFSGL